LAIIILPSVSTFHCSHRTSAIHLLLQNGMNKHQLALICHYRKLVKINSVSGLPVENLFQLLDLSA
jgi:hypothetical protein